MEIARIVLEYLKELAWPLIVAVALLRFAPAIRNLLGRLSEITSPEGYTARFDRETEQAAVLAVEADRTAAADRDGGEDNTIDGDAGTEQISDRLGLNQEDVTGWARVATRMARVRPVAMMLEAWSKLEDLFQRSAGAFGLEHPPGPFSVGDVAMVLAQLQSRGLSADFFRVGVELAALRQDLDKLMEAGKTPSATSAQDFVVACEQLMKALLGLPSQSA
ncbi:hypothetical protein [Nonomuraea basaltis]|uniref:hypothetical protein n=1 Tax=Nonomuraea basaltis TaxID=2495887 RepID=UPI00110C3F41|nr:hypothetical protein [Nonomuraea basaltis]TMR90603.1 hypothetical protein EJK15_54425 [Nonomuraea basaltis]